VGRGLSNTGEGRADGKSQKSNVANHFESLEKDFPGKLGQIKNE
jgi:hypothetical protein